MGAALTYAEFRKKHPATRCFQPYDSTERAARAASHRLHHRQKQAVGEFFYTHPMLPGRGYATAKQATMAAFALARSVEAAEPAAQKAAA